MTIKNLILLLAATAITACSDIDSDERYIVADSVAPQRCVLIEDFTGQNCVNCPKAHETIENIVAQYGDAVIPVSIHAGGFGIAATNTRYTGLMQPEGDIYNDAWGIDEWPKGVVNRSGGALNHDKWAETVRTEIAKSSPLEIKIEAVIPVASDEISITSTLEPSAYLEGKLQLWVIESGIVARQEDKDLGRIENYVHNNVYRASVNGVGGEDVTLQANIHTTLNHSIALRATKTEAWVPDNLEIVAFVYDGNGVIQATRSKVTIENEEN